MKRLTALILIGIMVLPTICFAGSKTITNGSYSIVGYDTEAEARAAGKATPKKTNVGGHTAWYDQNELSTYNTNVANASASANQGEVMGNIKNSVNEMGTVMDAMKPDIGRGFSFFGSITSIFKDGNSFLLAAGLILVSLLTGYNLLFLLAPIYSDQRESMTTGTYNTSGGGKKEPPFLYPATKKVIKSGGQDAQGQEMSSTQIISKWFTDMAGIWIVVVLYIAFTSGGLFKLISWGLGLFNIVF